MKGTSPPKHSLRIQEDPNEMEQKSERGRPATFDPHSGEVGGSGSGAGADGRPGEDHDSNSPGSSQPKLKPDAKAGPSRETP